VSKREKELQETSNQQPTTPTKTWFITDLGRIEYQAAWELQTKLVEARKQRRLDTDIALFLEHPPVFTLGRRGGEENLLVSQSFLKSSGVEIVHAERGGNITYHGPGQLVVYPILDIEKFGISVVDYVDALEEVMVRTAASWNINAERNPINRGIWVGSNKMGSIGIAIRRGIAFHGMALNVSLDLEPFGWIQPCGLEGVGMTSITRELDKKIPLQEVKETVKEQLQTVFGIKLIPKQFPDIESILEKRDR